MVYDASYSLLMNEASVPRAIVVRDKQKTLQLTKASVQCDYSIANDCGLVEDVYPA